MDLDKLSTEELEAELRRRAQPPDAPPTPLENPDFTDLTATVIGGLTRTIADGYEDEDLRAYVYEAAFTAIYGPGYWAWRRKQKW